MTTTTTTTTYSPEPGEYVGGGRRADVDAVVVGAGFAGLYMIHRLRQLGMTVVGVEAGSDVGGTWYWNRYPGARCDAVSQLYSFSFDEDIQQEWSWSERFAAQPEIQRYLGFVADRLELRPLFWFDTRVTTAEYASGGWTLTTDTGDVVKATYCVMATGCLSQAKMPEIPGLDRTLLPVVHTGAWPDAGVDVSGKRIAVIGTGSSGIQLIPNLASEAEHLVVLQRTPAFTVPAKNAPLDPEEERRVKQEYGALRESWRRGELVGAGEELRVGNRYRRLVSIHDETPEQAQQEFATRWESGGPYFSGAYADILVDQLANDTAAEFVRQRIAEIVDDPDVAETLSPRGFPIGAKRLCVDTEYFSTFNRDNVDLVDVSADPIARIEDDAVLLESGTRLEIDLLACATGFDAMTGALLAMDVRGRAGRSLEDAWSDGPKAYLGVAVHDFPNLFLITGPGSPSVLGNVVAHIEQHVEYIADLLTESHAEGLVEIEAGADAQEQWAEQVTKNASATLLMRADSWYLGANVPGKPRVFMPFVGGIGAYRTVCDQVRANGWRGFDRHATLSALG